MPPRDFPVGADEDGSRLETFLRKRLGLARPTALKALRKGWVRVDGKRAKGQRRLSAGETVRITNYALPLPAVDEAPPPARAVPASAVKQARDSLRHQEPDLLVSLKPWGMVVHAGSGHPWGWIDALQQALGDPQPPTPIGRLDRDTSGLLVLARGRGAARELFAQLEDGRLQRRYLALVAGAPRESRGRLDQALAKRGAPGQEQMRAGEGGRPAATRWEVVERLRGAALLRLELETGRTHQIRAHLAGAGWPILGDPRYGTPASRALSRELDLERLALHADRLRFQDLAGLPRVFEAPLPEALERVRRRLAGR